MNSFLKITLSLGMVLALLINIPELSARGGRGGGGRNNKQGGFKGNPFQQGMPGFPGGKMNPNNRNEEEIKPKSTVKDPVDQSDVFDEKYKTTLKIGKQRDRKVWIYFSSEENKEKFLTSVEEGKDDYLTEAHLQVRVTKQVVQRYCPIQDGQRVSSRSMETKISYHDEVPPVTIKVSTKKNLEKFEELDDQLGYVFGKKFDQIFVPKKKGSRR